MENKGYIYILTNPSFPTYVKIGYADDVNARVRQLNRTECTPFAFRVYATYAVNARLTDMKLHDIIDKLNPELRSIDNVNGKKRVREFYAMTAEDAYSLFEAMAEIHGTEGNLKLWRATEKEIAEERAADEIASESSEKKSKFTFKALGIDVGEELEYIHDRSIKVTVADEIRRVTYNGETSTLSAVATKLLGYSYTVQGPLYFSYKGERLVDMRDRLGV
ncbi:MAG: GIY-YIG nuclease family protein [Clostridia bacterium]|nr:GIY-YIG nuclease family protein [Clostridia bacterium]